jgi:hypothetical protein
MEILIGALFLLGKLFSDDKEQTDPVPTVGPRICPYCRPPY